MSHASTARITLGGVGAVSAGPSPTSIQQPFGYSEPRTNIVTPHQQAAQNRQNRRRRRENVPEHMKHTVNNDAAPTAPQQSQPSSTSNAGDFGTVFKAAPAAARESTTPAQSEQTQSLFRQQPQTNAATPYSHSAQDASNALYALSQQQDAQRQRASGTSTVSFTPQQPAVQRPPMDDADARRAEEARQKLQQLNLSPQVIEQYRRKFRVLDLNKDGVVNLREFAAISKVLGYKFSKEEVLEIFGRRDLDDSGGISFDEFVIAMYERAQKTKHLAPYREKFRLFDWKGRGYITSDEAFPILRKELGFDENKTETMIDMFDRNKDYKLSLLEFIDFYKKVEELKQQVRTAFHDFDRNGDGYVDAQEAKAVLLPKGFTEQQVEALIYKYDADSDGKLNYQEFASFWDVKLIS